MRGRRRALGIAYYGGLGLVLLGVLGQFLPLVLPAPAATRIGHNSEGLVLALVLAAWIQFARPRLAARPAGARRAATVAAAGACLALAVGLLASDLPSRFRTLNEAFLAAAVLIPYLQARRPLPRFVPVLAAAAVLGVVAIGLRSETVTLLAESFGVLLLAPIGFDLVDRDILDPSARPSAAARRAWYGFLVAAPVVFSVLEYQVGVGGDVVRYLVRVNEAFLCVLLVEVYFAYVQSAHGSPGSPRKPAASATAAAAANPAASASGR